MAWIAIWHNGAPVEPGRGDVGDGPIDALTFLLETAAPRRSRKPVRLWRGAAPPARAMAVYVMPDGGLRILHGDALDISTPQDFLAPGHILSLRVVASARGRGVVDALNADTGERIRLRTCVAQPCRVDEVLPAEPGFASAAHVAAIATHAVPDAGLPGIESGALVTTPDGAMPVERIEEGMTVIVQNGGRQIVRWRDMRERLCLGRHAPIRLRAPYFGLESDLCVTPETRLMRHGADVEYLAGTDCVLLRAGDLVPGGAAQQDRRQPLRRFHHLMLDDPACIRIGRCHVDTSFLSEVLDTEDRTATAARPDAVNCAPSLPLLDRSAARALLARDAGAGSFVL